MFRALLWLVAAVLVGLAAFSAYVRMDAATPAEVNVDLATAERTGRPNDFFAAPAGMTAATPDRIMSPDGRSAEAVMTAFDTAALAAPRVALMAGGPGEGRATYVQRSLVIGFPDYITVEAMQTDDGAALAVWSRARYGYSDWGVNRERVEAWLAAAGL